MAEILTDPITALAVGVALGMVAIAIVLLVEFLVYKRRR